MFNKSDQIVLMMPTSGDYIGMAKFSTDDLRLDSESMNYAKDAELSDDVTKDAHRYNRRGFKSGNVYSFDFPVMTAQTDALKTSKGGDIGEDVFAENKLVSVPVGVDDPVSTLTQLSATSIS